MRETSMATIDGRRSRVRGVQRDATTHAGLWLDKYLTKVRLPDERKTREEGGEPDPGVAIRALLEEAGGTAIPDGYAAALARRRTSLETLTGGVEAGVTSFFKATARGRLIIGLGTHSLRETNIALLHTWGAPYLPGSALKGLASAAAARLSSGTDWKRSPEQGPDHELLFGNTTQAGHVVFHDAWWMPADGAGKLPLDIDVMTVHHPDYYGDGVTAPADWDEPNPVAFLTAHGDYLVALSGPREWVARAGEWLETGLQEMGIGAKTQAGYGRMTLARELSQQEIEEQRRRALLAPRIQEIKSLVALGATASNAKQHMQKLSAALAEGLPAEDVREVARKLFDRERKTWRAWDKDGKWSAEQRALLVDAGILLGSAGDKAG